MSEKWRVRDEDGRPFTDVKMGEELIASFYPPHHRWSGVSATLMLRGYEIAEDRARRAVLAHNSFDEAKSLVADMLTAWPENWPDGENLKRRAEAWLRESRGETDGNTNATGNRSGDGEGSAPV